MIEHLRPDKRRLVVRMCGTVRVSQIPLAGSHIHIHIDLSGCTLLLSPLRSSIEPGQGREALGRSSSSRGVQVMYPAAARGRGRSQIRVRSSAISDMEGQALMPSQ
jgi:hypothetical protein